MNDAFAANLKLAYERIRQIEPRTFREEKQNGKTILHETNGVRVLFYDKSFKFPKFKLGLRYNEDWVEETVKFGHQPRSVRLCCLLDSKNALMTSWRDAKLVDALKVTLPKVELKPGPKIESPVEINGKLKAIVFDSTSLLEYLYALGELQSFFFSCFGDFPAVIGVFCEPGVGKQLGEFGCVRSVC